MDDPGTVQQKFILYRNFVPYPDKPVKWQKQGKTDMALGRWDIQTFEGEK